jgi:hypothetical protein
LILLTTVGFGGMASLALKSRELVSLMSTCAGGRIAPGEEEEGGWMLNLFLQWERLYYLSKLASRAGQSAEVERGLAPLLTRSGLAPATCSLSSRGWLLLGTGCGRRRPRSPEIATV